MTRARARALETEVTSLLSHFHFDAHETWLLPHMDTLCILRYHGEEEEEDGSEDGEEGGLKEKSQPPDDRPGPDVQQPPSSKRSTHTRRLTLPHPSQNYGLPMLHGRSTLLGRPTLTGRLTEDHLSRIYGRPDPREPPGDR